MIIPFSDEILILQLQCCGTNGPDDYDLIYEGTSYVPASCCPGALENTHADTELSINATVCLKEEAFTAGCSTVLLDFVDLVLGSTRSVLIIVIISEVSNIIFQSPSVNW